MTNVKLVDSGDSDIARNRRATRLLARHVGLPVEFKESELDRVICLSGGERKIQVELYDVIVLLQERMMFGHCVPNDLNNLLAPEIVHRGRSYRLGPKASLLLRLFEGGKTVSVDQAIAIIWPTWRPKTTQQNREGPPIKSLYSRVNRKLKELEIGMIRREGACFHFVPLPKEPRQPAKKK